MGEGGRACLLDQDGGDEDPPLPSLQRCRQLLPALAVLAAAALLLALTGGGSLAAALGRKKPLVHGEPPFCRKSSSMAVLPGPDDNLQLIVWSGIGKHKAILDDLHSFDMASLAWRREAPAPGPRPVSRWKCGNAQALADGAGLAVVAGDAYTPGTRHHRYENDVWRLSYPGFRWEEAAGGAASGHLPEPRRGHSTMAYVDAEGVQRIVVFGGRTGNKTLLNEAWEAALRWPAATWRLVSPQQPDAPDAPGPRRGHSAVLLPGDGPPQMLVYGGREDVHYFDDLWQLDIGSGAWQRIEPADGFRPAGRDHHAAAVHAGRLFVFAGRSGWDYCSSRPINSLWAFDLGARTWQRVPQTGDRRGVPLPRFEHSYAQAARPGSNDSHLVIFGGQTHRVCQLNDVWSLSLTSLTWRQLSPPRWCTRACRREFGNV